MFALSGLDLAKGKRDMLVFGFDVIGVPFSVWLTEPCAHTLT